MLHYLYRFLGWPLGFRLAPENHYMMGSQKACADHLPKESPSGCPNHHRQDIMDTGQMVNQKSGSSMKNLSKLKPH